MTERNRNGQFTKGEPRCDLLQEWSYALILLIEETGDGFEDMLPVIEIRSMLLLYAASAVVGEEGRQSCSETNAQSEERPKGRPVTASSKM